jgi:hypothetical protein
MVRHAGPKADRCECTKVDNGTEAFLLETYQELEHHTSYNVERISRHISGP